ncbi:UPF2 [Auxenochlorella protothecoides x Auxenochlorella symbiontica]
MSGDPGPLPDAAGAEWTPQRLQDYLAARARRREARDLNLHPDRPGEAALAQLDSSMKRNTALTRKLRTLTEETRASVLEDAARTNQSKYVAEAAAALVEAPQKARDVAPAAEVACALHRRYPDFGEALLGALRRELDAPLPGDEERGALARRRALLRLLAELTGLGLAPSPALVMAEARRLAVPAAAADPVALSMLCTLAKAGREELLGLPPAHAPPPGSVDADAGTAADWRAPAEAREALSTLLRGALAAAVEKLHALHSGLLRTRAWNERALVARGDLAESTLARYEARREARDALLRACAALAEALDAPPPALGDEEGEEDEGRGEEVAAQGAGAAAVATESPFEDEETRAFYEDLVDLRAYVPAVLLGPPDAGAEAPVTDQETGSAPDDGDADVSAADVDHGDMSKAEDPLPEAGAPGPTWPGAGPPVSPEAEGSPTPGAAEEQGPLQKPNELQAMLARLPVCVSREEADEAALAFCYAQSKAARKRLVRTLCDVPGGALALLPFFARIAATLGRIWPDIPAGVCQHLESEFRLLQKRKDVAASGRNLEARIRNMRYIGELLKFQAFPAGVAFRALKSLLDDFTGSSIDAACALVETAGRFLARSPATTARLNSMLDIMMRLKTARHLDARQSSLIDSVYSLVKAKNLVRQRKQRPPLHSYIRHLVYSGLEDRTAATGPMNRLRRLPWAECEAYLVRTLVRAACKGRHSALPSLASLAAGLARYHPSLGVALVDSLLEDVAVGLESPGSVSYQKRMAAVCFLGELYNYKLVNSGVVFQTLQLLLTATPEGEGYSAPGQGDASLDPPGNYFRIRLACALLETCGSYFTKGPARRRLDAALTRLAAYTLSKAAPLPLDVDVDLGDLQTRLGVAMPSFSTLDAALAAVAELDSSGEAQEGPSLAEEEEAEEEGEVSGASTASSEDGGSSSGEEESSREEEDAEGAGEDGDEEALLSPAATAVTPVPVEVDEDFEREFAAMLLEGKRGGAPPIAADAQTPTVSVSFNVMLRRGARDTRTLRTLAIPVAPSVEAGIRARVAAEAAERAQLKRLVLEANRRDMADEAESEAAVLWQGRHRAKGGGHRVSFGGASHRGAG